MPTPLKFKAPFLAGSFYHMVCKNMDYYSMDPEDYDVLDAEIGHANNCLEAL